MLTQIDVNSENAFTLPILGVTPKDSLLVREVTGLSPPAIDLFIGDYARDGGIYQGRRVGNRNVVLTIDLNPNPADSDPSKRTIAGLRELLYKAFVDPLVEADYVKLVLHDDDGRVRYLVGYTETFETGIFDVETMAQISIICPDPYLRDDVSIVLSHPSGWTKVPFIYKGTAETGFDVYIHINAATTLLTLENNPVTDDDTSPDYYRGRMLIARAFAVGDTVNIRTVRGSRAMTVTNSGGITTSIVGNLDPRSQWLELHSQNNTMQVYGYTLDQRPASIRYLEFVQSYWGI